MIIFMKIKDPDNGYDVSDIFMRVNSPDLSNVVEEFEYFLRSCGYNPKGRLEFIQEEDDVCGVE